MPTTSNIGELETHLKQMFNGMLSSPELKEASREVHRTMGNAVMSKWHSLNRRRTGGFEELLQIEINDTPPVENTTRVLTIGFGRFETMTYDLEAKRLTEYQWHYVNGVKKLITLHEEKELPKWIIAEFGAWGVGDTIPEQFKLSYTRRPERQFLYGPSAGRPIGANGKVADTDKSKLGFFMASKSFVESQGVEPRRHSGIKAGHIFSGGLKDSKQEVFEDLYKGIEKYLERKMSGG